MMVPRNIGVSISIFLEVWQEYIRDFKWTLKSVYR